MKLIDYACVDVTADSNRRTTQNVVEFLKDKSFMGGTRPLVRSRVCERGRQYS